VRFASPGIGSLLALTVLATLAGCGGAGSPATPTPEASSAPSPTPAQPAEEAEPALPSSPLDTQLPEGVREDVLKPFTGDLDEMVKRRVLRIGVTYSRTFYFVDRGVQRGVAYEYGQLVEERLNKQFKTRTKNKVHVFFVPLPRDMLLSALLEGRVDLVAAQITVRPELEALVDFTNPTRNYVRQILVTGPGAPALSTVDDLSGKLVFAREHSSQYQSLEELSKKLEAEGKPPVEIHAAPLNLDDDDLLEMVNAGLIPAAIVDDYLAKFWKSVLPNITVHENVAVRTAGKLAIAVRKGSPQLTAALNQFMGKYGLGTAFGNQVERRYLVETRYAKNATSEAGRKRFEAIVELFRKYSDRYDMDFLLMAAQGYQESQLNQNARSHVGAIGVMQVMPATGRELRVGDITQTEPNIHAGVKYMRQTLDANFKDEPMDTLNKALFTFASYNAGPGRVRQLRRLAEKRGLDPNVWFGNVEQIASERIGRETVTYVSNIYKYYLAYKLVVEERERKAAAKTAVTAGARK
jgi:membrane-bound lytic murein transglycosylase MltF